MLEMRHNCSRRYYTLSRLLTARNILRRFGVLKEVSLPQLQMRAFQTQITRVTQSTHTIIAWVGT